MKFNGPLFEDISRVASGAASAFLGFRAQVDPRACPDSVSRDEFESVRAMAAKAREIQEDLIRRIETLEAGIAGQKQEGHK